MDESLKCDVVPDDRCGQGWLESDGGRAGRWILGADRLFGPDCLLARSAEEGSAVLDPILIANTGRSTERYVAYLSECDWGHRAPEAYVFFPLEMPVLSYAMRVRHAIDQYACASYRHGGDEMGPAYVPGLGALIVYDVDDFMTMGNDGGLISEAKRCLEGVSRSVQWLCLAAPPSREWIEMHASSDAEEFHVLVDESMTKADWRWEETVAGSLLRELAQVYFQADRRWLYTSSLSFAWWPGPLRMDVIVHPDRIGRKARHLFVTATMAVAKGGASDTGKAAAALAEINRSTCGVSLASWDEADRALTFMLSARIDFRPGYPGLSDFAMRALIMARDAHDLEGRACYLFQSRYVDSALYYTRSRRDRDPTLLFLDKICAPTEKCRIPWFNERDFLRTRDFLLENEFVLLDFNRDGGCVAARDDLPGLVLQYEPLNKSRAGSGIELRLLYGDADDLAAIACLAATLNEDIATANHGLPLHGSWIPVPWFDRYRLAYRCFLPSALYRRGELLAETRLMLEWIQYWTEFRGVIKRIPAGT